MFLRFKIRGGGEVLMNMDQVVRIEQMRPSERGTGDWCRLHHLPARTDAAGRLVLDTTDVDMGFDRVSMLLSGRWLKDPT